MTLEFNKLVEQVNKLGQMLEKVEFDIHERLELALKRFEASSDTADVWKRIEWIREPDVSGYRGAAPLSPDSEPINLIAPVPPPPENATVIAVDGSQIYPDELNPVHYYLLNTGVFVYHHGKSLTPEQYTYPELVYHEAYVHDRYGQLIRNSVVNDRRTVAEIAKLAEETWNRRNIAQDAPIFGLYDNRLLYLPGDSAHPNENFMEQYWSALTQIRDAGAVVAGYIDNTYRSKRFIQLLFLMSLKTLDEVRAYQKVFSSAGDLDGLRDQQFFNYVLQDGERSAVMVQNSPQNRDFDYAGHQVAFFYLKASNGFRSRVVRVDIPVWVAENRAAVDALHALILAQCRIQGRNPYPYALTRADELAWVSHLDKEKLDRLVREELRKQGIHPAAFSAKAFGKTLARSNKRNFAM